MAPQGEATSVQPGGASGTPSLSLPHPIGASVTVIAPTPSGEPSITSTILLSEGVIISVPQPNGYVVVEVITSVNSADPSSPGLSVQSSFLPTTSAAPSSATLSTITTSSSNSAIGSSNAVATSGVIVTSSAVSTTSGSSITSSSGVSAQTSLPSRFSPSSSVPAASATNASASIDKGKSSNTGLIAGIAVLGALLAITLGFVVFLLLRRRRTKDRRGEYTPTYELKGAQVSPGASLENQINSLETQLHQRDAQLRDSQAALLQRSRGVGVSGLDDKQVNERFVRLSKSINDWVLSHFKTMRPGSSPTRDVLTILQRSQPNYATLLKEPRTQYLVIRSLVAEIIVQAFMTGELLGNPAFSELKQAISTTASSTEANEWRAQTMTLLEKSSDYQAERTSSVQEISTKIDSMTSNLAGLGPSKARLNHLNQVVESAATLALDLGKQRALFKLIIERPGVTAFDPSTMEDVLQDNKGENLQGRPIQVVVFPAVVKWGEGAGTSDRGHTISKAQVLV